MRTVIVDGHPDDLEKVKNILSDMEIELEIAGTASDGRAGYKLIVKERPDHYRCSSARDERADHAEETEK